ncbi:MAG: ABC transporter substrate-binding protein [Trueperaceae bacterium]
MFKGSPKSLPATPSWCARLCIALLLALGVALSLAQSSDVAGIYGPDVSDEAQTGGEIIVGLVYEPPALDPIHQQADATTALTVLMYQGLVYTDWDSDVQPLLATDWTVSDDGLTYTFNIREGVKFHDGSDLTAADVKYSYDYLRDPSSGGAGSVYLNAIDEIVVVDDYTVEIRLSSPNSAILAGLDNKLSGIFPEGYWETPNAQAMLNQQSVGTGPFMLEEFLPNQSITLVRNPDYWQPGVPYLEAITFVSVPDGNSLLNGLRTERIDLSLLARPQDSEQLTGIDGLNIEEQVSWVQKSIDLQAGAGVTANEQVRQAIALAIDKEQILQAAVQGYGAVIGLMPAGMQDRWGVPLDELPNQGPDIERAQELLTEAGYPDGLDVKITTIIGYDWMTPAAETLAAQLARVGINATIERQDLGVWINNWGARSFTDITFNDWGTIPDPSLLFDAHFQMLPVGNDFRNWENEQATELLTLAKQATGYEERHEYYAQVQELMAESAPTVPLFSSYIVAVSQDYVRNYDQHPSGWYFGLIKTWLDD